MTGSADLKTGKSKTFKFSLKSLPASLAAGTYHFFAEIIDPTGATDVVGSTPFMVQAPIVDLSAAVGAVKPVAIKVNHTGTVPITITDTGNIAALGVLDLILSPSVNGSTVVPAVNLATLKKAVHLVDHKPLTIKVPFKITSSLAAGSYEFFVSVTFVGTSATAVGQSFTAG